MTHRELLKWLIEHGVLRSKTDRQPIRLLLNITSKKKARMEKHKVGAGYPDKYS